VFKIVVSIVIVVVVLRVGLAIIRSLGTPPPPPPPAGEMRKVNLRYRCTLCGTEVRMTAAPDEDPPPPRHCQEDMQLMAPAIE
jgi:hypothetical protein